MKILKIITLVLLSLAWVYFMALLLLTYYADEHLHKTAFAFALMTAYAFVAIFRQTVK